MPPVTVDYLYDRDGNLDCITKATSSLSSCPDPGHTGLLTDYEYDYLNRLELFRSYDGSGNQDDKARYDYDALDRLTRETEMRAGASDDEFRPANYGSGRSETHAVEYIATAST